MFRKFTKSFASKKQIKSSPTKNSRKEESSSTDLIEEELVEVKLIEEVIEENVDETVGEFAMTSHENAQNPQLELSNLSHVAQENLSFDSELRHIMANGGLYNFDVSPGPMHSWYTEDLLVSSAATGENSNDEYPAQKAIDVEYLSSTMKEEDYIKCSTEEILALGKHFAGMEEKPEFNIVIPRYASEALDKLLRE